MTIGIEEFCMKKMAAGAFKTNCLAVMDEVQAKRETVLITKHGKPVAKLVLVESFRGDVLVWLALDRDARVRHCHLRDPSWFQWPLLEAAIEGNIVADFPLCNKSFNCSYAGHDL